MPRVELTTPLSYSEYRVPERASLFEVLKFPDTGASAYGSTYRKSLIQCPHEHGLLYEIGLRPETPTEALSIGLIFHFALQRFYEEIFKYQQAFKARWLKEHPTNPRGYLLQDGFFWGHEGQAASIAFKAILPLEEAVGYKDTWAVIKRCVDCYFDMYTRLDRWEILAVEETVEYLGAATGTFNHTARLDLFVYDTTKGRTFLVEHKTAKFLNDNLLDFYDLDFQILGQCWLAAKCLDWSQLPPFGGVLINIVTKAKTPIPVRHPVLPRPDHLRAFELMVGQLENLRTYQESIGWPKSLGQCAGAPRGYSKCQFYEVCREHPLETVKTIGEWRDAPAGFAFKGRDASTFENHEV